MREDTALKVAVIQATATIYAQVFNNERTLNRSLQVAKEAAEQAAYHFTDKLVKFE